MDDSASAQSLETSMEYMKFCAYVVDKEMQKFNLDFATYQSFVTQLPGILDVNFDIAYNRCAFMYKYTLCNIYFFKDCMNKFILEYPELKNLVTKWTNDSDSKLCSLSCGPGLDYLSFMLSLSDHLTPPSFKSVTILSKYGAWRNTVNIVADGLQEGILFKSGIGKMVNFKNTEVVQAHLLVSIPAKGLEALQQSSVVLMVKTLNLTAPALNEEIIKTKLLELVSSLKLGTTIFFIDTKPSLALFMEVLTKFDGKFLFKPEHLSFKVPVTFSEEYKERNGCLPVISSRGAFFVWRKLSSFKPDPDFFNICPINPPVDAKEISNNSVEILSNENEGVLTITRTQNDLMLSNNSNDVYSSSLISDKNISVQPSVSDMKGVIPALSTFAGTPKQEDINKSASIQNLVTSQSVRDLHQINFDDNNCSPHYLKKSSSIDNSFFQCSSKSLSFFGDSDLRQNTLYGNTIEENYQPFFQNKTSEIKREINAPKSSLTVKPASASKSTQTEFYQADPNSSAVKVLTDRVKRLVSSLENEVQKNIPDDAMNNHPHTGTNCTSCSTNYNDSDVDIKPQSYNTYQTERKNPIKCYNSTQMNHVHCCALRHNMMHCCQSCFHGCSVNPHRPFCESNIFSSSTSSAQPQIVIPLQNISNDILQQIISAAKSNSKPQ